ILGAVLWPCLIWTLLHAGQYDWPYLSYVFLLSLVLAGARHYSGSLYVPLSIHMFFNLVAALLMALDVVYGLDTI
ncbi:MAG: CPBP family intramembrane metalloprotease, partial [Leptospiraceae bacterium]|nr:CPBP family intramembrane metalloprotease [Leptospiraceae bacterium]